MFPSFLFSSKNLSYYDFSMFSLRGQLHRSEDTNCKVLDLAGCQNQFHHRKFLSEEDFCDWFILLIIHIHLGSCQPLGSFLIKPVASLCREMRAITPTSLLKKNLTYSPNFKVYFMKSFAAAKASLVFIKNRCKSSRLQMFFKIGVIKNLAMFTGKQLLELVFNKVADLQVFSCEYCKIAKSSFFIEHLRWLLLQMFCLTLLPPFRAAL